MNRNEYWMAACVLALTVGIGVGRAQERPVPPAPVPPSCPNLSCDWLGLEAVGCKACIDAIQAVEAKCKACTECAGCEKCGKAAKESFASGCGCSCECAAVKKAKKSKKNGVKDQFYIAVPPPPTMPMAPPTAPVAIYAPTPVMSCPAPSMMPMPVPPAPVMVFRVSGHGANATCEHGCGSGVKQAKYETAGKFGIALGIGLTGGSLVLTERAEPLEIDCGAGCRATCTQMTLHTSDGKELTIASKDNKVVITGPSLKATCDSLTRCGSGGSMCLMLQGHVQLHQGKDGMKTHIESDQVELVLSDGMVEVHTVTKP